MLIVAEKLTKDYGRFRALDAVDLVVKPGEIVGLLGPNGSGKTTCLRLMLGFLRASAGRVAIGGFDCWSQSVEARKLVTYLPGELRLYENMTGRQLVQFLSRLRGETRGPEVDQLARRLDIDLDRWLTQLSSGMKRKVALLTVLLPRVPLIILDEPTNTLDPTMRDELLDQLRQAKQEGKAILFSSHVLQEVEAVCDRVAILRRGQLVHSQDLGELREGRHITATITGPRPTLGPEGTPLPEGSINDGGRLDLEYRGSMPPLLDWLASLMLADLRIEPLGLASIYRKYHGASGEAD